MIGTRMRIRGISIRPKHELLLLASRKRISTQHRKRIHELLGSDLDWGAFLADMDEQNTFPLDRFGSAGIPTIPYEGPALVQMAYGHLRLRGFAHLDLLLRQRDIQKAEEEMQELDFRPDLIPRPSARIILQDNTPSSAVRD